MAECPVIDCHNHVGADVFFYVNGFHPYAQDLPHLVAEGRRLGVGRWIVFPMVTHLWFDVAAMRAGRLEPGGPERVPYAFENERMLREVYERHPEDGARAIPFVMFDPAREVAAQIGTLRELRRLFPFYGFKLQPTIIQADAALLLSSARGFLDLAAEWEIPVLIHSSIAPDDRWAQTETLLRVAEAVPHVRFCLAHSCRFDRPSLDRLAALPNAWFDCSAHRIHCQLAVEDKPAVAVRSRRFSADYRDPAAVLQALAEAYPRKLLWGSDTPFESYVARHGDEIMALRSTYADEVACLQALPAGLRQEVSWANTRAFLKLDDEGILARG